MGKSGWFTPQALGLFRTHADGDWEYFPFGRFGRGYRVRAFDKDDLWAAMIRFQVVLIVAMSLMFAGAQIAISYIGGSAEDGHGGTAARTVLSLMAFVGVAMLGILLFRWYVRGLVKDFPLAETQLTAAQEYRLWATRIPTVLILPIAILGWLGCIGTLIGIWPVLRSGSWLDVPELLLIAAISGLSVGTTLSVMETSVQVGVSA